MEGVDGAADVPLVAADGVLEAAQATLATTLSAAAVEFHPGGAARALAPRPSRERSPHGARSAPASASSSASPACNTASASAGSAKFVAGNAVTLEGLVSRPELVGQRGVVKSFDSATSRYAVRVDAANETVRVLEKNMRALFL